MLWCRQGVIGGLDITTSRNYFGRQLASFEAPLHAAALGCGSFLPPPPPPLSLCLSLSFSLSVCAYVCKCVCVRRAGPAVAPPPCLSRASVAARARRPWSSCCKPVSQGLAPDRPCDARATAIVYGHTAHTAAVCPMARGAGGLWLREAPELSPALTDPGRAHADMLHLERLMRLCTRASAEQVRRETYNRFS
jgi:hypothetical protein